LEDVSISGAIGGNDGSFEYQLFQATAHLCRYESYREICQEEKFHLLIDKYLQSLTSQPELMKNWTEIKELTPLLRCLANLSENFEQIQMTLQHNIPFIAGRIDALAADRDFLLRIDDWRVSDLLCACFDCLKNLLIDTDKFSSQIPIILPSLISIFNVIDSQQYAAKRFDDRSEVKRSGFALLIRCLEFKEGRKQLLLDDAIIEWVVKLLKEFVFHVEKKIVHAYRPTKECEQDDF